MSYEPERINGEDSVAEGFEKTNRNNWNLKSILKEWLENFFDKKKGGTIWGVFSKQFENPSKIYYDVLSYTSTSAVKMGILKITFPKGYSNTTLQLDISGYNWSNKTGYNLYFYGESNVAGLTFMNAKAEISNGRSFTSVRTAFDGSKTCLLLGTKDTVWEFPRLTINKVIATLFNINGWETGWSVDFIGTETGLTNMSNVPLDVVAIKDGSLQTGLNADLLDGKQGELYYSNIGTILDIKDLNNKFGTGYASPSTLGMPKPGHWFVDIKFFDGNSRYIEATGLYNNEKYRCIYVAGNWSDWSKYIEKDGTLQSNLNADLLDSKDSSYFARSGFGGGGEVSCNLPSEADILCITNSMGQYINGNFMGYNLKNSPSAAWYFIKQMVHNNDWVNLQILSFTDPNAKWLENRKITGKWQGWKEM